MNEVIIIKTRVKKLHNLEHIEFHAEFIAAVKEAGEDVHRSTELVEKHDARFATLDTGLKRIVKSPRTEELQKADRERDETYRGLVSFNKAMTLHHDGAVRAAAGRLQIVIDAYKNVTALNYEEETGAIYNLVEDLKSPKYAPDAAAVGLTPWVLKLAERNNTFKTLMNIRDQEAAAPELHIAVSEARIRLDKIYVRLRNRINSYVDDEEANPALEALNTQLNIIAKRFNTLAARHHKAGKKDGGEHHSDDGGEVGEIEGGTEG